jgi:hypothetical protein
MKTYEDGQDVGAQVDVHDFSWLVQNAQRFQWQRNTFATLRRPNRLRDLSDAGSYQS